VIRIGIWTCGDVDYRSDTLMYCTLPAGAGFDQPIIVTSAGFISVPKELVSYAAPNLTSVSGCTDYPDGTTRECPRRADGTRITIRGENFGQSNAAVFVGGVQCADVEHTPGSEHSEVTCTLPSGTRLSRAIMLIQDNGEISINRVYLSYAQCQPGNWSASETDYDCTPCDAGSVTTVEGQMYCTQCEAGKYTPSAGMSTCLSCLTASRATGTCH
jgi:hypothetical protein